MRTTSRFTIRALVMLALAGGLLLAVSPGDVTGQQKTTTGTTTTKSTAQQQTQQHPSHIHAALHELKNARHQLEEARHDYGGHREHALKAVDHAIHELEGIVKHETQNASAKKK